MRTAETAEQWVESKYYTGSLLGVLVGQGQVQVLEEP